MFNLSRIATFIHINRDNFLSEVCYLLFKSTLFDQSYLYPAHFIFFKISQIKWRILWHRLLDLCKKYLLFKDAIIIFIHDLLNVNFMFLNNLLTSSHAGLAVVTTTAISEGTLGNGQVNYSLLYYIFHIMNKILAHI
jgi:hypothetical protein